MVPSVNSFLVQGPFLKVKILFKLNLSVPSVCPTLSSLKPAYLEGLGCP